MSIQQRSYFCPVCNQQRLFTRQGINHTPHILASVFLCGLWLPVWFFLAITDNSRFHCSQCGFSDAPSHLANPNLRQQRREQMDSVAFRVGKIFKSCIRWFGSLDTKWKVIVIVVPIITFILIRIMVKFLSK
jgi:hypothetical protein